MPGNIFHFVICQDEKTKQKADNVKSKEQCISDHSKEGVIKGKQNKFESIIKALANDFEYDILYF